jgi:hypothetical protein
MIDYDGEKEKSDVITISRSDVFDSWDVTLYPNPSQGEVTLDINLLEGESVNVRVLSLLGQVIYNENIDCEKGKNVNNFDLTKLSKGIYHIEVSTISSRKTLQYIKQ